MGSLSGPQRWKTLATIALCLGLGVATLSALVLYAPPTQTRTQGAEFHVDSGQIAQITVNSVSTPTSYTSGWVFQLTGSTNGTGYSCSWTFSDGGTSSSCNVAHTLKANGVSTWTLTITLSGGSQLSSTYTVDHAGCGGSDICPDMVTCWPPPCISGVCGCGSWGGLCDTGFCQEWDTGVAGQLLSKTTGPIGGATYTWSMGDGNQVLGWNAGYQYTSAGNFGIQLTATSGGNQYTNSVGSVALPH